MNEKKNLTILEAGSTVTGYGIGGGVMAVPFLASLNGILPFIFLLVIAFLLSVIFHLMLAEIMMRDKSANQLVEVFSRYLFRGKAGPFFTWIFFILIVMAFITNLSAYIAGSGEILRDLLGIPVIVGHTTAYIITAGVVFFGLKAVGLSEKYAVLTIVTIVALLSIFSLKLPFYPIWIRQTGFEAPLALFGMIMFSFASLFSVPQAVEGLNWNRSKVPFAIILGLFINLCVVTTVTVVAICVSKEVTRIAITGWSRELGSWAFVSGSAFILLAMLTSYWSISLALTVIVEERLKIGNRKSWLLATLPTYLIVVTGVTDFLGFMRIAGGAIALIVAILVIPTYRGAKKHGTVKNPVWRLGVLGSTPFQILVAAGFILMSIGSLIQID